MTGKNTCITPWVVNSSVPLKNAGSSSFRFIRLFIVACIALPSLTGCLAPPKPHPWEAKFKDSPGFTPATTWTILSTNFYVRVIDTQRTQAVAMLKDVSFVALEPSQVATLAPQFNAPTNPALRPYLVRGASYSIPPMYTVLQFDDAGSNLSVEQYTYNGEMLMPFRWVAEPDAIVTFLPRAPEHVFPGAMLGGDVIFRIIPRQQMDRR